jgi:hypothetical protein
MPLETVLPVSRVRPFPPRRDYASLSIKDLLDARDAYHVYLSTLDNVVATAVGRYLIHKDDWYADHAPNEPRPANVPLIPKPRTLLNSVVRPWSWPAVLVFIKEWQKGDAIGDGAVPHTLYLADGRVVPTCLVLAPPDERLPLPSPGPSFNSTLLGGGYSCLREHQGQTNLGTFACLVRKGGTYYALTNRHVAGGDGEVVRARIRGDYVEVGTATNIAIDRLAMSDVFPDWAGPRIFLTGDAGLVRIVDINDWTSQAFGIGEIGDVFDATRNSVTLDLIDCPVRGFGGSSGVAEGCIRALFYRYQSLGGFEYATDVLIGPRAGSSAETAKPFTRPGDSGTVWFYDPPTDSAKGHATHDFPESAAHHFERGLRARRLRPIAMQWGGQRFVSDGKSASFALGTFLSSICRALDVEVVRDWSTGHDEYWGKIGHFAIGFKACEKVDPKSVLGDLMMANQARIGFGDEKLGLGSEFRQGRKEFIPLADVPDYAWIGIPARPAEPIQHFADVDIFGIDGGPTMLQQCIDDPATFISATQWKEYFDGFASKDVGPDEGCLPFRVWQIWEAMVAYLKKRDVLRFVAAAGVMAHYVGDASQPMHCSYLHHGIPPLKTVKGRKYPFRKDSAEFKAFKKTTESKIHGIYEEGMLEVDAPSALADLNDNLRSKHPKPPVIKSGFDAAHATILLMDASQRRLSPKTIINADDPSLTAKGRGEHLWKNKKIRDATIASLADSVRLLAVLWTAAWEKGNGDKIAASKIREYTEAELTPIYRSEKAFLPSLSLKQMAESGKFER